MTFADAIRRGLAVHAKISSARAAIDSVLERAAQEVGAAINTRIRFRTTESGDLVAQRESDSKRVVLGTLKLGACGWPVELRGGCRILSSSETTFADDLADIIAQAAVAEKIYKLGAESPASQ